MATQSGNRVKLEAVASTKSTPRATRREKLPVLVRVTAAPGPVRARAEGVDLVAVLDVSGSMNEDKGLERLKEAMVSLIEQLGQHDRLSIVSFNDQVLRRTELSIMSDENREKVRAVVNQLTAPLGGGANVKAAMEEAAQILAQRGDEEQSRRTGRIIFLSSGGDDDNDHDVADPGQKQNSSSPQLSPEASADNHAADPGQEHNSTIPELVAVEVFGLGADDSLSALSYGAEQTTGVYTYAKQDVDKILDANAGGVTCSYAAMGVQINLQAEEGVGITALGSGAHRVSVGAGGRKYVTIYIHDLYAGEHKSFLVYLTVPEGVAEEERLLTVSGLYRDPESSDGDDDVTQLEGIDVSVLRPEEATPADETICTDVAAEIDRASRLVEEKKKEVLEKKRKEVLEKKKMEMMKKQEGNIINQVKKKVEGVKLFKVKIMSDWSNPYYFCSVALLLLLGAAMLLMSKKEDDRKINSLVDISQQLSWPKMEEFLDTSQHPGWPKMEESLGLAIVKKMEEDAKITSLLHSAAVDDMSRNINSYLYQAIVHASVFVSRCKPEDVGALSLVEQKVDSLEVEKKELLVKREALTKGKMELAVSAERCAAVKENDEALERANTWIAELERQLHDKKAFADSLRSEVANTDVHLKTCGQRVDILETKVREMEVTQGSLP